MKFGRSRPVALGPHFKLGNYLRATLPTPPPSEDYSPSARASLSNILGNDSLGDCVIASGYHVEGVATGNAGACYVPPLADVISDYSSIAGYVPGDPSTDNGTDEITALNWWTKNGFKNGTKLPGWATVDGTNRSQVMSAVQLFEHVMLCLELPNTYVNPFPSGDGFTWDVGTPNPDQGHAIMACGYNSTGVKICTWGMLGTLTWAALASLCVPSAGGGTYVVLTPDIIAKGATKAPNGFAWGDLIADIDTMGANIPIPPPPAPSPAPPGTVVTLAQAQAWAVGGLARGHALMTRQTAEQLAASALAAGWPKP